MNSKKIILASSSPRRKDILKKYGLDFEIINSQYDENISNKNFSKELVEKCAYNKAKSVFDKLNDENVLIISADTVVVLDGLILGKPNNKLEAFDMLKSLSNKTHFVATSFCIMSNEKFVCDTDYTYVSFRELNESDITKYIETKKPFDKAGSYGIQDEGFDFAIKINGELDTVIGFPLKLFLKYKTIFGL